MRCEKCGAKANKYGVALVLCVSCAADYIDYLLEQLMLRDMKLGNASVAFIEAFSDSEVNRPGREGCDV